VASAKAERTMTCTSYTAFDANVVPCEPSVIQEIGVELVEMIDTQTTQRTASMRGQM
jgi:hypothetical protein